MSRSGSDAAEFAAHFDVKGFEDALIQCGITEAHVDRMNQKARRHVLNAVRFIMSSDVKFCTATTALVVSAIVLAKQQNIVYAQIHAIMGLHREGAVDDAIKGVSKARLNRFLGLGGAAGTITARTSSSTGKCGFLTALGIVSKSDKHSITVNRDALQNSAFLTAYAVRLSGMTDGAFSLLEAKSTK